MGQFRDFSRSDFSTFWLTEPKCTEIWSEQVPDFPILGQSGLLWSKNWHPWILRDRLWIFMPVFTCLTITSDGRSGELESENIGVKLWEYLGKVWEYSNYGMSAETVVDLPKWWITAATSNFTHNYNLSVHFDLALINRGFSQVFSVGLNFTITSHFTRINVQTNNRSK